MGQKQIENENENEKRTSRSARLASLAQSSVGQLPKFWRDLRIFLRRPADAGDAGSRVVYSCYRKDAKLCVFALLCTAASVVLLVQAAFLLEFEAGDRSCIA